MADDIDTPLKARQNVRPARRLPVSALGLFTFALAALLAVAIAWVVLFDDPLGGEPRAIVKLEQTLPPAAQTRTAPEDAPKQQPKSDQRTITIIDGNTGARREIPIGETKQPTPPAKQSQIPPQVDQPQAPPQNFAPVIDATNNIPPADKRLIEDSKHGSLPKVGPDGVRPLDAYASPIPVMAGNAESMIAIVITGLGVSASATGDAIAKLPPAVTLGFVPYGSDLPRWVARARGTGHEVLLHVPMEPFDYPDNDPGPQTLTVAAPKDQNLERLHYFLSRAQGYVGIANLMGARFTANEEALAAILAETGRRGLLFLDDGSSPRSASLRAATKAKAPFLQSNLVIDAKPEWADIDAALVKLEALAAEKGLAIASASALPVTIERISRWAKTLEARGIRLVPVSVAFQRKPKQS